MFNNLFHIKTQDSFIRVLYAKHLSEVLVKLKKVKNLGKVILK